MKIYLVGFMGAGKSTTGPLLATRLGSPFVDLDELVEGRANRTIDEIFANEGEPTFRRLEHQVLGEVARRSGPAVVATGGGLVEDAANRAIMERSGTVVWLDAPLEVLRDRLRDEPGVRPLARDDETLADRWMRRRPLYATADLRVDARLDPGALADEIWSRIERRGEHLAPNRVEVNLGPRSYEVLIGSHLVAPGVETSRAALEACGAFSGPLAVVADAWVHSLYGHRLDALLEGHQPIARLIVPPGESSKSLHELERLTGELLEAGLDRKGMVIALGGGVAGDLGGLTAACYMRGVPFVQVPTTLLAQVDASVGGKVAVNHRLGKNLIGAFHQPRLVLADLRFLASLAPRDLRSGMAEVIKHALIEGDPFFSWVEAHAPRLLALPLPEPDAAATWQRLVTTCVRSKADVVEADEREQGRRMVLNLGHTFGHALERAGGYKGWTHGEAVAWGLVTACRLAHRLGWMEGAMVERVAALIAACGLPTSIDKVDPEALLTAMAADKKRRGQGLESIPFVLPRRPGAIEIRRGFERSLLLDLLSSTAV